MSVLAILMGIIIFVVLFGGICWGVIKLRNKQNTLH